MGRLAYITTKRQGFRRALVPLGSLLNYLRWLFSYKTRVETDSGAVQDDDFTRSVYKILSDYSLKDNLKLLITAEGGLKTRTSGVERYVTKAYDLSDNDNDPAQTTEADQPFLGGRIAPNEIQNFKSVTGVTKTLTHTGITVSGTYTIIKVLNAENDSVNPENSGKTVVSFTEVTEGTYNSISWTGRLYAYAIYGGTISGANQALIETDLLNLVAEVESVTIGTQEWATSNCEMVATPMGNVINEMQAASAMEKVTVEDDRTFASDTGWWTKGTGWTIGSGVASADGSQADVSNLSRATAITSGKWHKVVFTVTGRTAGTIKPLLGTATITAIDTDGTYTKYIYSNGTTLAFQANADFVGSIDNVSVKELGWADSQELYDGLIAQGYSEQDALKECGWWSYYNNDSALGAIYGKLYNWFATKLLQNDIDAYNTANPTTPWGWHVPLKAEFDALIAYLGGSSVAGGKMKAKYDNFDNENATNESGLTILPGGYKTGTGTFGTRWGVVRALDYNPYYLANNVTAIYNLGAMYQITGCSLRLIRDSE